MKKGTSMSENPQEGQIVFVHGGVAQYRDGVFYTGMEDPRWERPIQWDVTWWLPTDCGKEYDAQCATIARMREALEEAEAKVSVGMQHNLVHDVRTALAASSDEWLREHDAAKFAEGRKAGLLEAAKRAKFSDKPYSSFVYIEELEAMAQEADDGGR
jgi:hypothetical protein